MAQTQMTKREDRTPVAQADVIRVPDVDIREDAHGIKLWANMPGVDPASVDVNIENNVLTLAGHARWEAPAGYELVGREYEIGRYRRDFTLSDEVDRSAIKARVSHGVLEITLPKREEVKSRKIQITS